MTRQEIIADHIATLRSLVSSSDATTARMVFAHAVYAALATPGCEAQGVRLVDLPHLAERVAEMADAHEALRAERDEARAERHDIPHHIRLALNIAQRAFDDRDLRVLGTFSEDLQPMVDAAAAWITALSRDLSESRAETKAARAEVTALRAQVAELQRLGASIHKAADAARKAERADVVAELRRLYAAQQSRETPVAAALDILVGLFESGAHEGAASPK